MSGEPPRHRSSRGDRHDGAAQLTVCFGERSRGRERLLADELLDLFGRHRVRASALLRCTQGFGAKHRLRSDRLLTLSEDLPLMALAVDEQQRIAAVAEEAGPLVDSGLVTVEPLRIATHGTVAAEIGSDQGQAPGEGPTAHRAGPDEAARPDGRAQGEGPQALELAVHIGRYERAGRRPAFAAVCELLHQRGVAGATVLLGVDGTRHGRRRRARFFARNAHVPMLVLAVGERQSIESVLEEVQGIVPAGLLTLKSVRVCKRDGLLLDTPASAPESPSAALQQRPLLQRLTIVTSEAATHDGRPVHLELIQRLRAAGAAGATSLRGIWGFHGEHAPHGDRLLSLRRHVPVVTVLVDAPERVARLFEVVDELTRERGLVTSELLPANIALPARL